MTDITFNTQSKLNLLLIDDDPNEHRLLGFAVRQSSLDIRLHLAQDTQQAMEHLEGNGRYADRQRHPLPELILLDLKMALQDAVDFLTWRTTKPRFAAVPVLLYTGSQDPSAIGKALALGAHSYIPKPDHFQELKRLVHRIWDLGIKLRGQL